MGSRWWHCLALMCFAAAAHSNQVLLKGPALPALVLRGRGVPCSATSYLTTHMLPSIYYSTLYCQCCPNISHSVHAAERVYDRIWGRGKSETGSVTQWKDTCWERKHMPPFFFCEPTGSTHRRPTVGLLHTQRWLSSKQWPTEIDVLLRQRLVHIHPSLRQSHLGRLVLPGAPSSWCGSRSRDKTSLLENHCGEISAENHPQLLR